MTSSLYFVALIFLFIQGNLDDYRPNQVNALYYNNRNECNSVAVDYQITFRRNLYLLTETVTLIPRHTVSECFFYADDEFQLMDAWMDIEGKRKRVSLEFYQGYFIVRVMAGWWLEGVRHRIHFKGEKKFNKSKEGMVFRTYRDLKTKKKYWYSIVKMAGMNCGSIVICVNNFWDQVAFNLTVTHPNTHSLFCSGKVSKAEYVDEYLVKSRCQSNYNRNPNDLQFALAKFFSETVKINSTVISIVSIPGVATHAARSSSMDSFAEITRGLTIRLAKHCGPTFKPFIVVIYMLPNFDIKEPIIKNGYCYFTPDMFIPGSTKVYVDLMHCLLRQAYLIDRQFESWSIIYGLDGLLELLVGNFEYPPYVFKRNDFSDCLDGASEDYTNLADLTANVQKAQVHRPARKAAGFWRMLEKINSTYAKQTFAKIRAEPETMYSHDSFVGTLTEKVAYLNMTASTFEDMLYSWTAPKGFPIIEASVVADKREVCIMTYNYGQENYKGRYILPFKVSPKYPFYKDTITIWSDTKAKSCVKYPEDIHPYLINRDMSVIGRILYDEENYLTWIDVLAEEDTSHVITYSQKVNLINDIFFFATQNRLDYMIALHYVQLVRKDVDERLWALFDRIVAGLDAKARYTPIYNAFTQYIGDLMIKLFEESVAKNTTSMVAIKWSCFMNMMACRDLTEGIVSHALINHEEQNLQPDFMCAGIRKISWNFFMILMNSFGQPDWREPHFYIDILICSENPRVLRTILLHMFYLNSWHLQPSVITEIMLKMIRMSKVGSDMIFWYLDHDPMAMKTALGMRNLLIVADELANYVQYTQFLDRLTRRLHLKKVMNDDHEEVFREIKRKIRRNKRWHNRNFVKFQEHVYDQYSKYVLKVDG